MGYDFERNEVSDQKPGVSYCVSPIFNFIPSK